MSRLKLWICMCVFVGMTAQTLIADGLTPADGAKDVSTKLSLGWTAEPNAVGYQVWLDENPVSILIEDTGCLVAGIIVEGTSLKLPKLGWGKTYYWHVSAVFEDGLTMMPTPENSFMTLIPDMSGPDMWLNHTTETSTNVHMKCSGIVDFCEYDPALNGHIKYKADFEPTWHNDDYAMGILSSSDLLSEEFTGLYPGTEYEVVGVIWSDETEVVVKKTFKTLGEQPALIIYRQPVDQHVAIEGEPAVFTVGAHSAQGEVKYTWYKRYEDGFLEKVSTDSYLLIPTTEAANVGHYFCMVSVGEFPGVTSMMSDTVSLTIEGIGEEETEE